MHELVGRAVVTNNTSIYNLFGLQVGGFGHSQVVDICPTCDWQETEAATRRARRALLLCGGAAVGFLSWAALGGWGLLLVGAGIAGTAILNRRNRNALTIRK